MLRKPRSTEGDNALFEKIFLKALAPIDERKEPSRKLEILTNDDIEIALIMSEQMSNDIAVSKTQYCRANRKEKVHSNEYEH